VQGSSSLGFLLFRFIQTGLPLLKKRTRDQDSGSEYDPLQDDTTGDILDGTAEVIVLPYSQGFNCTVLY